MLTSPAYFVLFAAVLVVGIYILNKDDPCRGCDRRVSTPDAHWSVDTSGSGGWSCSPQRRDTKWTQDKGTVQNMSPQPAKVPLIIDR